MPSKSKTKGSSFEREIAKFLSDTYSASFVRVPNSGAYTGGANSHRKTYLDGHQAKSFKGDIIAPDDWVYFNSECKNYNDFPFHLVLAGNCKKLDEWLSQLLTASNENDINIMFIKVTRKGRYVCVQSKLTWKSDNFMYYTSKDHGDWIIADFDKFFELNKEILKLYSIKTTDTKSLSQHNISTDTKSLS